MSDMMKADDDSIRTKVIGTIGPASSSPRVMSELMDAGMDIARINFSHGDHETHRKTFSELREISKRKGIHLAVMCDIQGPKIRTGDMERPFRVNEGDSIRVTSEMVTGTPERIMIDLPGIEEALEPGDSIFINDGIVRLKVIGLSGGDLLCEVRSGGLVSDRKGCNIPSSRISAKIPTEKDERDLELIAELDPEYLAASFVGTPDDVENIRNKLGEIGNERVKIISKIERPLALENLDDIIGVSDGLMVARGDLGVEIPVHEVPAAQKRMCRLANRAGIPVVVATQMLNSMIEHSSPTRAEASDVFNSVLDGADAVMLSNETAVGRNPPLVVRTMKEILKRAEDHIPVRDPDYYDSESRCMIEAIGHATFTLVKEFDDRDYSGKVIAVTDSGHSARMISKYRPDRTIVAVTPSERTARELSMIWGVVPLLSKDVKTDSIEERMIGAVSTSLGRGLLEKEDHVIVVSSSMVVGDSGMFASIYDVSSIFRD